MHTTTTDRQGPGLIECYPHVALLALLNRDYRVPYKVSRSTQYWKAERPPIAERVKRPLAEFSAIPLTLPQPSEVSTLSSLKPVEDRLDALICAWIGIEHLEGRTVGLGDSTAAIWAPPTSQRMPGRLRSRGPLSQPDVLLEPMDPSKLETWESSPLLSEPPER